MSQDTSLDHTEAEFLEFVQIFLSPAESTQKIASGWRNLLVYLNILKAEI